MLRWPYMPPGITASPSREVPRPSVALARPRPSTVHWFVMSYTPPPHSVPHASTNSFSRWAAARAASSSYALSSETTCKRPVIPASDPSPVATSPPQACRSTLLRPGPVRRAVQSETPRRIHHHSPSCPPRRCPSPNGYVDLTGDDATSLLARVTATPPAPASSMTWAALSTSVHSASPSSCSSLDRTNRCVVGPDRGRQGIGDHRCAQRPSSPVHRCAAPLPRVDQSLRVHGGHRVQAAHVDGAGGQHGVALLVSKVRRIEDGIGTGHVQRWTFAIGTDRQDGRGRRAGETEEKRCVNAASSRRRTTKSPRMSSPIAPTFRTSMPSFARSTLCLRPFRRPSRVSHR